VYVVGELQSKTAAASRGFLATAGLSCLFSRYEPAQNRRTDRRTGKTRNAAYTVDQLKQAM